MEQKISLAYDLTANILQRSALDGILTGLLPDTFGNSYNTELADDLIQDFTDGNFAVLPPIEIVPRSLIAGGNGAYDRSNNVIYLAEEFVANSSSSSIKDVWLEEIGHFIDGQINVNDTPGDEGYLFSQLVQGNKLSRGILNSIITEDDTVTVDLYGKSTLLELADPVSYSGNLSLNANWSVIGFLTANGISDVGSELESTPYEWQWEDLDGNGELTLEEAAIGYDNFSGASVSIGGGGDIVDISGSASLSSSPGGGSYSFNGSGSINIPGIEGSVWNRSAGVIGTGGVSVNFVANPGLFTISSTRGDFRYTSNSLGSGGFSTPRSNSYTFNIEEAGVYGFNLERAIAALGIPGGVGGVAPGASFSTSESFSLNWSFTPFPIDDDDDNDDESPENQPPDAINDSAITGFESPVTIPVLSNDTDPDNSPQPLSITSVDSTSDESGMVEINGTSITYTPAEDFFGIDTFSYTISDGEDTDTAFVTVDVEEENEESEAPIANDDSDITVNDSPNFNNNTQIDVLDNDDDPDGTPPETISINSFDFTSSLGGSIFQSENGRQLIYVRPNELDFGFGNDAQRFDIVQVTDTFTYDIIDTDGQISDERATVTVNIIATPPTAEVDEGYTTNFETTLEDIVVLDNDSDPDGDDNLLGIVDFDANSANGGEVILEVDKGSKTFKYIPPDGFSGEDSFQYTIQDVDGLRAEGTVNLVVEPQAPEFFKFLGNEQGNIVLVELTEGGDSASIPIERTGEDLSQENSVDIEVGANDELASQISNIVSDSVTFGSAARDIVFEFTQYVIDQLNRIPFINITTKVASQVGQSVLAAISIADAIQSGNQAPFDLDPNRISVTPTEVEFPSVVDDIDILNTSVSLESDGDGNGTVLNYLRINPEEGAATNQALLVIRDDTPLNTPLDIIANDTLDVSIGAIAGFIAGFIAGSRTGGVAGGAVTGPIGAVLGGSTSILIEVLEDVRQENFVDAFLEELGFGNNLVNNNDFNLLDSDSNPNILSGTEASDTFSGTLSELNGDTITNFTEDDIIAIEGIAFAQESLTVTQGSAILDIDTDLDGTNDATITLEGDFSNDNFVVEPVTFEGVSQTFISIDNSVPTEPEPEVPTDPEPPTEPEQPEQPTEPPLLDGDDVINGDNSDNILFAGEGNNIVYGFEGNDLLEAGSGNDTLDGNKGADTLIGGEGNNILYGFDGDDFLTTGSGSDTLDGGNGVDSIESGDGNDIITAGDGDDFIDAGGGNDTLSGGGGDDSVIGGSGDDLLNGDNGNDTLNGGSGTDRLVGGGGNDVFVLNIDSTSDTFSDFNRNQDFIGLSDGLTFDDLIISGSNSTSIVFGDNTIAVISGLESSRLNADRFIEI